ncbi:hypothetical protein [Oscillibacter sp.]|uniref:hypothetical protein n=1 Tax=Oscillibacter sp. TaxID=1945593 RepID=UPI0028B1C405|nr:hypothetical protein [Oscillibacter sp.]
MTDTEIRHLSKTELLSILRDQEAELEQQRTQIEKLQSQQETQIIQLEECGSIAEASLQINHIFQVAQASADQYLASIRQKEVDAEKKARQLETETNERAKAQIRATDILCRKAEEESQRKAAAFWDALQLQLEQFYNSHEGLKDMLTASGFDIQIPNRGD